MLNITTNHATTYTNSRGDYFFFRTKRGRFFEGGYYFRYCSLKVVP